MLRTRMALASGLGLALFAITLSSGTASAHRGYRPAVYHGYYPLYHTHWAMGLHLAGATTSHKIDRDGVALGGAGGHLRYRGTRWGSEFAVDFMGNEFLEGGVSRLTVPIQGSVLFYVIPRGMFNLFILAGMHGVFNQVKWDLPNLHTDQLLLQVGGHVGVGAELNLGYHFAVTGDLRFFGRLRNDQGPDGSYYEDVDTASIVPKESAGAQLNLGVSWRF